MEQDLNKIIEQCKANDHKAFEIVHKKYYRLLLGIALRYTRNLAEAEDVLQDAFIKIFHNIGSYGKKGSFEGWLKRIVQNTAINSYRSKLRFELYIDGAGQEESVSDDSLSAITGRLGVKDIITLLNGMPDGYRLVFNLYYIDGYTHQEIAEMMQVTVGTSKSQLFKARNYLRSLMATYNYEEKYE